MGNPSDGYHGKTIAFTFTNFCAEVTLYQSPEIEILPNDRDHSRFANLQSLVLDVDRYGYYGGIRLLKATVKKFHEYCFEQSIPLDDRNFTIRYTSNIPHGLGLAGSSAIITACIKTLMAFYSVEILKPILANIVLSVETDELAIPAGLQDRVAQVYQGIVCMDFSAEIMAKQGFGDYEYLESEHLPNFYIAFRTDLAESSDKVHGSYRSKYKKRDSDFQAAIDRWIELTDSVKAALENHKDESIAPLLNENFDIRRTVQNISEGNLEMVTTARSVGASAKFTGSGGAVIGTFKNKVMFDNLQKALSAIDVEVIIPRIAEKTP